MMRGIFRDRLDRVLVHVAAHSVGIGGAGQEESLGPSEVVAKAAHFLGVVGRVAAGSPLVFRSDRFHFGLDLSLLLSK